MVDRLLRAAQQAFLQHGYQATSVSALCKQAGVANGSFYQYFPDKEAVFRALVERFEQRVLAALRAGASTDAGARARISGCAAALLALLEQEASALQVFREAEFVALAASRHFYQQLDAELPALLALPGVDPRALTDFFFGALYFNALSRTVWGQPHEPLPTVVQWLLEGMAPAGADARRWRAALAVPLAYPAAPPSGREASGAAGAGPAVDPARGEQTRRRLLDTAESLFGTIGYAECTIARLTEAAGVGLGTFYLHFPGKQALLGELVRRTSRRLTRLVAAAVAGQTDRLAIEVRGLLAFLDFLRRHGAMYRVVREAEFVDREIGAGYYRELADGYAVTLAQGMRAGQVRELAPRALGLGLMGVGHFCGLRWLVGGDGNVQVSGEVLGTLVELMMRGLLGVAAGQAEPAQSRSGR